MKEALIAAARKNRCIIKDRNDIIAPPAVSNPFGRSNAKMKYAARR